MIDLWVEFEFNDLLTVGPNLTRVFNFMANLMQHILFDNVQILALLFPCSQVRMLQFLDSLLSYLPASCSIQPLKCTRREGASQISAFSLALEKEVLSLREGVSSLLCEKEEAEERSGSTGLRPEPGSAGLLQCREAWQRDLERTRTSPLVDIARYRRLIQSLSKVQLTVDMAALLDTQRGLFC